MHSDRGTLLFRVTAYRFWRPWEPTKIIALMMLTMSVPLFLIDYSRGHRSSWFPFLFAAQSLLLLLSPRNVKFYEKGIHFPHEYIAWSDIGRYRWDGNMLIIREKSGLLEGGETVLGGTVRVPRSQRAQVENLLRTAGGAEAVPPDHRAQTNPGAHSGAGGSEAI